MPDTQIVLSVFAVIGLLVAVGLEMARSRRETRQWRDLMSRLENEVML